MRFANLARISTTTTVEMQRRLTPAYFGKTRACRRGLLIFVAKVQVSALVACKESRAAGEAGAVSSFDVLSVDVVVSGSSLSGRGWCNDHARISLIG